MKNQSKAYYLQVLGLSSNFNETELKDAYRREAKKWHPDLNKDDIYAEERLQLINEAYAYLKNSKNNNSAKRKSSNSYSTNRTPKRKSSSNVRVLIIAYISFILISLAFWDQKGRGPTYSEVESVKKTLAKGVEECRYRYKNNLSIRFRDAQAFSRKFDGFKIEPTISYRKIGKIVRRYKSTCFEAKATPLSDKNTWFRIKIYEFSFAQGFMAKYGGEKIKRSERFIQQSQGTCGDSSKPGCQEKTNFFGVNTWSTDGFYRAYREGKL